jgi:DNA-binding MarR family transcriptional regulator
MVVGGYVERDVDPADARAKRVQLSDRGRQLLTVVEEVYDDLEREWAAVLGEGRLEGLRADLAAVLSSTSGGRLPPVRVVG